MEMQSKTEPAAADIEHPSALWSERAAWVRARANEAKVHETRAILETIANLYEILVIRAH
jgi:hypothetical protein